MNTILEIHNNRSKSGRKEGGSLPHPRKVNPIPPVHYTWNKNLEIFKRNTILEIRNHSRPSIIGWRENTIERKHDDTISKFNEVTYYLG